MVWLAKWIRENREGVRVLIITDRTELYEQICRTTGGHDLIAQLNTTTELLLRSLVHQFGGS